MTRPSRRFTLIGSSVNCTSSTRSSAADAEKLVPAKSVTRIRHHRLHLARLVGAATIIGRSKAVDRNVRPTRCQPEDGRFLALLTDHEHVAIIQGVDFSIQAN
jgi:hypothetical protein